MITGVRIRRICRRFPLVGGLVDARFNDYSEACQEVVINVVLSTVPIWFGALIMLTAVKIQKGLWDLILDNMNSGELFLYATALLAPLYYFVLKEGREIPNFPSRRGFIVVATLILLISVGLFAVRRAGEIFGEVVALDHEFIFSLSWKVYLCGVFLVYLAYVYKNLREEGAARVARSDTDEFLEMYRGRQRD